MSLQGLQVHLRDINPKLVAAWDQHFRDLPHVTVSQGDIFGATADAIVSPANSFGFMDGGIDLVYSEYFGWQLSFALQELIFNKHDGELPVGQAEILPTGKAALPWLISAPTMRIPSSVVHTPNAYLAFRAALRLVREHNQTGAPPIRTLLCPGLGTAIGRLPPNVCARQMRHAYDAVVLGQRPKFEHFSDAVGWHSQMIRDDL